MARDLASRYWMNAAAAISDSAAQILLQGLARSEFRIEKLEGRTTLHVDDPQYTELYVMHEYEDGVDRVTVGWVGNF